MWPQPSPCHPPQCSPRASHTTAGFLKHTSPSGSFVPVPCVWSSLPASAGLPLRLHLHLFATASSQRSALRTPAGLTPPQAGSWAPHHAFRCTLLGKSEGRGCLHFSHAFRTSAPKARPRGSSPELFPGRVKIKFQDLGEGPQLP